MLQKTSVALFKELSLYLPGRTKEEDDKYQSG